MTLKITFDPNIPTSHALKTYETSCSHISNEGGHNAEEYSGGLNEVRFKMDLTLDLEVIWKAWEPTENNKHGTHV